MVFIGLATFASGIAIVDTGMPPQKLIDRLQAQIQIRFRDINKGRFGAGRLGEPYISHKPLYVGPAKELKMTPENKEERAILASLNSSGWDTVAFTARYQYLQNGHQDHATKRWVSDGKPIEIARVNGPVLIAGQERRDFRTGTAYPELERLAKVSLDSGRENSGFDYNGWKFITQRVHARPECLSCHTKQKGGTIKVGDSIGLFLLGFKKT